VSITHGIQSLTSSHGHDDHGNTTLNLVILVGALIIEGLSLLIAVKAIRDAALAEDQGFMEHLKSTDDPFGIAILAEDSAAVFGVILALIAVGLTAITGEAYWDAVGSIAIGVLLGGVAFFLIRKNRDLLIGRAIRPQDRSRLQEILENDPAVEAVAVSQAVVTGTESYRISAELDFDGAYLADKYLESHDLAAIQERVQDPEALKAFLHEYGEAVMEQVGDEVDRIEDKIRTVLPKASNIALEPD
jgi:zinc transporter 9